MTDVKKDKGKIVRDLIPDNISECALYLGKNPGEPCSSSKAIADIGQFLNISGSDREVMDSAKVKTGCTDERCVLEKMSSSIAGVKKDIDLNLKIKGPQDAELLSNVHIDKTLRQWNSRWQKFFPYNFNMLNYASYSYVDGRTIHRPDSLATILFSDLCSGEHDGKKYDCCGCVINSDTYQGSGKHWMALFADARGGKWSVEFFNSSGNAPAPEWVSWMEKTKVALENRAENDTDTNPVDVVKVSSIRHQRSKSECGLYSLFYIWARIHGIPYSFFDKNHIPDSLMFEFRQHLFDDPNRENVEKFDWEKFKKTVNIKWES